jgi:hypothetical protein
MSGLPVIRDRLSTHDMQTETKEVGVISIYWCQLHIPSIRRRLDSMNHASVK